MEREQHRRAPSIKRTALGDATRLDVGEASLRVALTVEDGHPAAPKWRRTRFHDMHPQHGVDRTGHTGEPAPGRISWRPGGSSARGRDDGPMAVPSTSAALAETGIEPG